jgi:hypothetical protein
MRRALVATLVLASSRAFASCKFGTIEENLSSAKPDAGAAIYAYDSATIGPDDDVLLLVGSNSGSSNQFSIHFARGSFAAPTKIDVRPGNGPVPGLPSSFSGNSGTASYIVTEAPLLRPATVFFLTGGQSNDLVLGHVRNGVFTPLI